MSIKEELTKSQVAFLVKYKIPEELLINANGGEITEELGQKMSEEEKAFAYNTSACDSNKNHQFKTADGVCPQCNTASIQIALKEYEAGYVYIIGSVKAGLVKVGMASEIVKRVKTLNGAASKFANCDDWEMLFYAKTTKIGKTVGLIQEKLANYLDTRVYSKNEKPQKDVKMFRCSYSKARQAFTEVHEEQNQEFTQKVERSGLIENYQFRNLIVASA